MLPYLPSLPNQRYHQTFVHKAVLHQHARCTVSFDHTLKPKPSQTQYQRAQMYQVITHASPFSCPFG
jgi:hypothetical protein